MNIYKWACVITETNVCILSSFTYICLTGCISCVFVYSWSHVISLHHFKVTTWLLIWISSDPTKKYIMHYCLVVGCYIVSYGVTCTVRQHWVIETMCAVTEILFFTNICNLSWTITYNHDHSSSDHDHLWMNSELTALFEWPWWIMIICGSLWQYYEHWWKTNCFSYHIRSFMNMFMDKSVQFLVSQIEYWLGQSS